ncbi:PREDICTED: putative clathrin assembly protein At5g10410 [Tarenaya hassleriana]|uniref:putative clathrin assembly protein At5g10410 n=1 Tax=Tarenaya hassleriana TaxID=28532 RepID=UPI00053C2FCE|nr:PREDICTED: putative clathrin assembly protein At5g10410 [Tarenaya hassleriana]
MAKLKSLIGKLKDKASEGKAGMVHALRPNTRSLHLALLKSTTHNCTKPPADDCVAAVISYSGSRRYAPATVSAVLSRLQDTRDACVAAKSLIILHKIIKPDHNLNREFYIKDHHFIYSEGRNNLKINNFRDHSSHLTLELSPWIRWYVRYLDCLSSAYRVLGYFPNFTSYSKERAVEKNRVSSYKTGYLVHQTGFVVSFFECICQRPENPALYQNKIVDGIRELVAQDYFSVMPLVMVRLEVLNERLTKPDLGYTGSDELGPVLVRLEQTKEKMIGFSWRCKVLVEDFWFRGKGIER